MSISEVTQPFFASAVTDSGRPYDALNQPPLVLLAQNIRFLDYRHRKFLLECSRVQKRIGSNKHLKKEYSSLIGHEYQIALPERTIHALVMQEFLSRNYCTTTILSNKLCLLFDNFYDDPLSCALLSYLVRAESTDHVATFLEQLDKLICYDFSPHIVNLEEQAMELSSVGYECSPIE